MNEAREGVAIFGQDGECRYASEGFEATVGGPLFLRPGELLDVALARQGVRRLGGIRGGYEGPQGAFYAAVEHLEGVSVVRVSPLEARDPRSLHGRFLSVASHDLRGALANVRSYASLLKSPRFALDPKAQRAVEVIARNTDKALALAEDIFDGLKADARSLRIEKTPEALGPMVEKALEACQAAATEKGVMLGWSDGGVQEVVVDPDRFTRACASLLLHALWRTPEGGRAGLEVSSNGAEIEICAWDEGAHATPDELASAFDRDARVARERSLSGGFRLCLAASFAHALGGDVGSRVDHHGRQNFFFTVPSVASEQQAAHP